MSRSSGESSGPEIRSAAQDQTQRTSQQVDQKQKEMEAATEQTESQKREAERMAAQTRDLPQQERELATAEMDAARSQAKQKKKELEDAKAQAKQKKKELEDARAQAEQKKNDAQNMIGSAGDFTPEQGQDRATAEGGAMMERGSAALIEKAEDLKGLLQAKLFKLSVAILALILLVVLVILILMVVEAIEVEEFSYILLVIYVMMTLLELLRERVAYLTDNSLIYEKLPARQFLCQPRYLVLSWLWIPASLASGDRATVYRILCETFISITVFFASLSTEEFFCGEGRCSAWDNTEPEVPAEDLADSGVQTGSGFPTDGGFGSGFGSFRRALEPGLDALARRAGSGPGSYSFSSPGFSGPFGSFGGSGPFGGSGSFGFGSGSASFPWESFPGSLSKFSGSGGPLGSGVEEEDIAPPAEVEKESRTYILSVILIILIAVSMIWAAYLCFKGTILTEVNPRHKNGWMNRLDQVADVFSLAADGEVPHISDAGALAGGARERGMAAAEDQKQKARERVEAEKQRAESRAAGAQDEARGRAEVAARERADAEKQRLQERVDAERQRAENRAAGAQQEARSRGEAAAQDQRRQADSRVAGVQEDARARGEAAAQGAQGRLDDTRVNVSATRFGHGHADGTGLMHGVHSEDEPLGHTAHEIAEEASKLTGEDFNKPPSPYDWKLLLGPLLGIIGACVAAGLYYYVGKIDQDRRRSSHAESLNQAADSAKSSAKTAAGVLMVLGWTAAAETALGCYHALVLKSRAEMVRTEMASQQGLDRNSFDAATLKAFHDKVEEIRHTAPPGLPGGLWQGLTMQLPMFTAVTILIAGIAKIAIAARGVMINFAELEPFTFVLEAAVVVGIIILFFLITAFILVKYPGLRCTPDGVTPELERELKETAAPPPVKTREIALPIPMTRSAPPPPPPPAPKLLPPRAPRLIVHPEPKYPKKEEKDGVSATVVIYERRPVGTMMVSRIRSPSVVSMAQVPIATIIGSGGQQPSWQGVPISPGTPSVAGTSWQGVPTTPGPSSVVSGTIQSIKFAP